MPTRNFKDENDCYYFEIVFDLFWDMEVLRALQRIQKHSEQSSEYQRVPRAYRKFLQYFFKIKRSL